MSRKRIFIAVPFIALIGVAIFLLNGYVDEVKLELDNKSEWSIVEAGLQQTVDNKPKTCEARFFRHGEYHAVGFWSGNQWVWLLVNSRTNQEEIKVLPATTGFYISDSNFEEVKRKGANKSLLNFIVKHRLKSCPI